MQGSTLFLLVMGAVNLVNLLLIRASSHMKDMAIRRSMGASRRHVVSHVLVETLLLTGLGGLLGLVVGASGVRLLEVLGADRLPLGARIAFDDRLAAIGLAGAVLLGAVIALSLAACDNETTTSTNTPNPAASQTNVAPEADEPEVVVCDDCGTITSITPIAVEGESSGVGAAIGAVIGGLAGSQVGEGRGTAAAIVAGAVGGGFLGRNIERERNAGTVYDVAISMDDGSFQILRVEDYGTLQVGQEVRVNGATILPPQN